MFLTTKFGYIPVEVLDVERFADGSVRSVKIKLPEGSIAEKDWVYVSDDTGKWIVLEWGMTPLSVDGMQPMSSQCLEFYLQEDEVDA